MNTVMTTADGDPQDAATTRHTSSSAPVALVGAPVLLTLLLAMLLLAFGLPAVKAAPHDLPIGIAGPPAATAQVRAALEGHQPGAFAVSSYADEAELTRAIRSRDVYGGIAVGPQGPTVFTAGAASPVVAQVLAQLGTAMAARAGAPPVVRDVVPLPAEDPRGVGLSVGMLPLVIGTILPAAALGVISRRRSLQMGGALVYSVVAGVAFAAVLQYVFGTLDGDLVRESGVLAATLAAGSLALLGLQWLAGRVGLAMGALTLVLLGNPLSGATSAPEFLASPWREIGQAMPPGAGSQLLRTVAFFDGNGSLALWWVLAAWAGAGLLLMAVPPRRPAHLRN